MYGPGEGDVNGRAVSFLDRGLDFFILVCYNARASTVEGNEVTI